MSSIGALGSRGHAAAAAVTYASARSRATAVTSAASLLDDGAYGYAQRTGSGVSSFMMFGSDWSSSTGKSGTFLDYFV